MKPTTIEDDLDDYIYEPVYIYCKSKTTPELALHYFPFTLTDTNNLLFSK
jgi:hypothetical protein